MELLVTMIGPTPIPFTFRLCARNKQEEADRCCKFGSYPEYTFCLLVIKKTLTRRVNVC